MKNELIIKKCNYCETVIKVIEDWNCDSDKITCCNSPMQTLIPNSVDASVEKHIPTYEIIDDELVAKVNHVMEKEHYIEWITLVKENKEYTVKLYPEQKAECRFPYIKGSTLYAYCNKHGLWKAEVQ